MIDYDTVASEYARHRGVHPEVLRSLLSTSGIGAAAKVLEVGCGTGNYIKAVHAAAGCSCWGTDPSEHMLAKARERSGRIHFQQGVAERLDFSRESFDVVLSVDVIHHLENRPAYFREAHRVLKTGGRICTVTDSESIIRDRRPLAVYFPETVQVDLARYPAVAQLREIMESAAFDEIAEERVSLSYQISDIQAYRDKACSCLHLIPPRAFQQGIQRMEDDLRVGPIQCVSQYLLLWGTKQSQ